MPDSFNNARRYFDVSFPSSGDGFSISGMRNVLGGLGFMDFIPLQPRAHSPADRRIMVRGTDASSYYNQAYWGNADQRVPLSSGDTGLFSVPASNPRIDIVYITPSGNLLIQQGTEASVPGLPSLAPSGDSRFPICAVWCKPGMAKVVNFEDKDSNSGDGYIYKDLRPWMRTAGAGSVALATVTSASVTGDNLGGVSLTASRADHHHQGVHTVKIVGSGDLFGDIEISGTNIQQAGNRITITGPIVQQVYSEDVNYKTFTADVTASISDSVPQDTVGESAMTASIRPKNVSNILEIEIEAHFISNNSGGQFYGFIFRSDSSNAIQSGIKGAVDGTGQTTGYTMKSKVRVAAGTTSQITISLRVGMHGAGNSTFLNGNNSGRLFGGTSKSFIQITEYAPLPALA